MSRTAFLLPLALLMLNFNSQNLSPADTIRARAEAYLAALPAGALVLTPGDPTIFTLWYFHHVEDQRPDLILVDQNLFAFDWYRRRLAQQQPTLHRVAEDDLDGLRQENQRFRPVCTLDLSADTHLCFED